MSERDDGGPAFPQSRIWNAERAEYEDTEQFPGMTLRDWFAGQALPGLMGDLSALGTLAAKEGMSINKVAALAAYEVANAMLEARK